MMELSNNAQELVLSILSDAAEFSLRNGKIELSIRIKEIIQDELRKSNPIRQSDGAPMYRGTDGGLAR